MNGTKVTATGAARVPEGCKIERVVVRVRAEGKVGISTAFEAKIDATKNPATWTVTTSDLPPGEHWFDTFVEFSTPERQRKVIDGLEKRRVHILRKD